MKHKTQRKKPPVPTTHIISIEPVNTSPHCQLRITFKCLQCGVIKTITRSRALPLPQFCSHKCSALHVRRRFPIVTAVCQQCGTIFKRRMNRDSRVLFCGQSCSMKYRWSHTREEFRKVKARIIKEEF